MIGAIFKFIGLNKVMVITGAALLASLAGSGYLLKQSYADNGRLENQVEQLKATNEAWATSWLEREQQHAAAIARLSKRELDYQLIRGEFDDYQEKVAGVLAGTDRIDCGLQPDLWMLIKETARNAATSTVRSD